MPGICTGNAAYGLEAAMEFRTEMTLKEKLKILADAAKYDVACTSSGSSRRGKKGMLGNSVAAGVCHSFAADGRCISLLKILMSNACVYDCRYCQSRVSNDCLRTTFTPEEICSLVIEFYRRNYIEGLFLSSAVIKSPAYTMEKMCEAIWLLRNHYRFRGYIHVKVVPGAPEDLIRQIGFMADRLSVNLELPTYEGLRQLAPHKKPEKLIAPMRQIQQGIADYRLSVGKSARMERHYGNHYFTGSIFNDTPNPALNEYAMPFIRMNQSDHTVEKCANASAGRSSHPAIRSKAGRPEKFAPAGQSTQMIIGATKETDFQLLMMTQRLYQRFDLKRVFFSAYVPLNEDSKLPSLNTKPPLLREHRLYQADWLLRYYGFRAEELLSEEQPNLNIYMDPKCHWAVHHLELFPVEINQASYEALMRVPGIGYKSATRIIRARRAGKLDFHHLKKIGVVLKRAMYFITCQGKMLYKIPLEEGFITRRIAGADSRDNWTIEHPESYRQLSLFEDFHIDRQDSSVL